MLILRSKPNFTDIGMGEKRTNRNNVPSSGELIFSLSNKAVLVLP